MRTDFSGTAWWEFWKWDWVTIGKVFAGVVLIAGLAVGTIFTGGTLSVVLAGATIGALAGAVGSTISTAVSGDWANFGNNFLMGIVAGGISGAVSASGLNVGWQILVNVGISVGNYAVNSLINGNKITLGGLISSAVFGAIAGAIGGNGLMRGNSMANAFIAFGGKNFFATIGANILKQSFDYLIRMAINSVIVSGVFNGSYSRFVSGKYNSNQHFIGW